MRLMRNFGFAGYDSVIYLGTNGKMTEICAAMGLTSLEAMDEHRRGEPAQLRGVPRRACAASPGLSVIEYDDASATTTSTSSSRSTRRASALTRDELIAVLHAENVLARKYFWPGLPPDGTVPIAAAQRRPAAAPHRTRGGAHHRPADGAVGVRGGRGRSRRRGADGPEPGARGAAGARQPRPNGVMDVRDMTTRTEDVQTARTIADVRREARSVGLALGIMQPYVFPYLGYFQLMAAVDRFVVYDDVAFIKQGWINRNHILVDGAPHRFTIPLHDPSSFRAIDETSVDPAGYAPFVRKFLRTIDQSYQRAACFSPARALVADVFEGFEGSIGTLALRSLRAVARYVGIGTAIVESSHTYGNGHLKAQERVLDICAREGALLHQRDRRPWPVFNHGVPRAWNRAPPRAASGCAVRPVRSHVRPEPVGHRRPDVQRAGPRPRSSQPVRPAVTPSTRSSPVDVLVTCGGKWVGIVLQLRAAMAAVPALCGGRVLVSSSKEATPAGAFADAAFVVPLIADPCYIDVSGGVVRARASARRRAAHRFSTSSGSRPTASGSRRTVPPSSAPRPTWSQPASTRDASPRSLRRRTSPCRAASIPVRSTPRRIRSSTSCRRVSDRSGPASATR